MLGATLNLWIGSMAPPRPNGPHFTRSFLLSLCCGLGLLAGCSDDDSGPTQPVPGSGDIAKGKETFRFDTFGDETFWTDTLRMHEVIQAAVSPQTALSVGLKVDADAVPPGVLETADLTDPATTVALLKLGAVVGLKGTVQTINGKDTLTSVGITCALCHSTVNNSVAAGIGSRLDGWPNLDLDPGAIIALSPSLTAEQKAVYQSWGPGRYDARYNFDGRNDPALIPPAYGLSGVHSVTYTGDGDRIAYWNRYVAVTQMHGHGSFTEPRLGISVSNPPDMNTRPSSSRSKSVFSSSLCTRITISIRGFSVRAISTMRRDRRRTRWAGAGAADPAAPDSAASTSHSRSRHTPRNG